MIKKAADNQDFLDVGLTVAQAKRLRKKENRRKKVDQEKQQEIQEYVEAANKFFDDLRAYFTIQGNHGIVEMLTATEMLVEFLHGEYKGESEDAPADEPAHDPTLEAGASGTPRD